MAHEINGFEQCTLFNSGHEYRDGYDRSCCSCGWKSVASKDHKALVALWEIHARTQDDDYDWKAAESAVSHLEWLLKHGALDDRKDGEQVGRLRGLLDKAKKLAGRTS